MAFMVSVRLASKDRNCFPFLVKPLTSEPHDTKIFSWGVPWAPPSASLDIFWPGKVLNTGCKNRQKTNFLFFPAKVILSIFFNLHYTLRGIIPTTASPFFIPKHVSTPSWSATATCQNKMVKLTVCRKCDNTVKGSPCSQNAAFVDRFTSRELVQTKWITSAQQMQA